METQESSLASEVIAVISDCVLLDSTMLEKVHSCCSTSYCSSRAQAVLEPCWAYPESCREVCPQRISVLRWHKHSQVFPDLPLPLQTQPRFTGCSLTCAVQQGWSSPRAQIFDAQWPPFVTCLPWVLLVYAAFRLKGCVSTLKFPARCRNATPPVICRKSTSDSSSQFFECVLSDEFNSYD
jgi:hypothetical protein